jgi:hypothetical protein
MTSFTADPATITDGDSFTLRWAAPCGFVSLAQKGKGPFMTLLPSTGSYALRPGLDGYPAATGNTVYEARNADTATPREATVTTKAKLQVSVSASPDGCHPQKWNSKACTVTCAANATGGSGGTSSYQWSGCASGAGSTGTCSFTQPGSADCTVTVTDGQGRTASASKTVQGVNAAPGVSNVCWKWSSYLPWGCIPNAISNGLMYVTWSPTDDDPAPASSTTCTAASITPATCSVSPAVPAGSACGSMAVLVANVASGTCTVAVTATDDWGASATTNLSVPIVCNGSC